MTEDGQAKAREDFSAYIDWCPILSATCFIKAWFGSWHDVLHELPVSLSADIALECSHFDTKLQMNWQPLSEKTLFISSGVGSARAWWVSPCLASYGVGRSDDYVYMYVSIMGMHSPKSYAAPGRWAHTLEDMYKRRRHNCACTQCNYSLLIPKCMTLCNRTAADSELRPFERMFSIPIFGTRFKCATEPQILLQCFR